MALSFFQKSQYYAQLASLQNALSTVQNSITVSYNCNVQDSGNTFNTQGVQVTKAALVAVLQSSMTTIQQILELKIVSLRTLKPRRGFRLPIS